MAKKEPFALEKYGEVPSLHYIAIQNMPACFWYPRTRYMLEPVFVI